MLSSITNLRNASSALVGQWYRLIAIGTPIVGASLSNIAMAAVDTAIVGRLGVEPLAAATIALTLFLFLAELLGGLAMGFQPLVARAHGNKDSESAWRLLLAAVVVLVSGATAILGLALLSGIAPFLLLTDSAPVAEAANEYFLVRSVGLPILAIGVPLRMSLDAKVGSKWGFFASVLANLVNAALSAGLAWGLGPFPEVGLMGVAWAAVVANACSSIFLLVVSLLKGLLSPPQSEKWACKKQLHEVISLGISETATMAALYGANIVVAGIVGSLGVSAIAASRIILVMQTLSFSIASGIGSSIVILLSGALSTGDYVNGKAIVRAGLGLALVLGLFVAAVIWFPGELILRMFTDDAEVIKAGLGAIGIFALTVPIVFISVVGTSALRALKMAKRNLYIGVAASWLVLIPSTVLMVKQLELGFTGVYFGFALFWLVRAVVSLFVTFRAAKLLAGTSDKE